MDGAQIIILPTSKCYNTVIGILQGQRNDFESGGAKLKLIQFSDLVQSVSSLQVLWHFFYRVYIA